MEKKSYHKAMEIARQVGSPTAKHNKLISLAANVDDRHLAELASDYATWLLRWPKKPSMLPSRQVAEIRAEVKNTREALIAYAESVLASQKPEWQVLAEQHGWTPPVTEASR